MITLGTLRDVLGGELVLAEASVGPEVRGVELDSRRIAPGVVFAALPGTERDGIEFAQDAAERGAAAVLLLPADKDRFPGGASLWIHPDARAVAGRAAALLAGRPSRDLHVVGVTGTNGKTSVTRLAVQLLEAGDLRTAEIGTVGYRLAGGVEHSATHTTPDAPALQRLFAEHRAAGGRAVVLEASSHALDQERLAGTDLDVAVFTNLTRDHLDYHRDMERYASAKARLFEMLPPTGTAVVHAGDPFAERMADAARRRGASVVTYAITNGSGAEADLCARDLEVDRIGTRFTLEGMGIPSTEIRVPLFGRHNVENALAALAVALVSGVSSSDALEELTRISPAPGRLEEVAPGTRDFSVLVDYAHTENALEAVLGSLREILAARERGRILCVFGCGGDRDPGKRSAMGRVVGRLADVAVVTSDNPRGEEPEAIVREVWAGLSEVEGADGRKAELFAETDRRSAIELAVALARTDDFVLIAGKGHETTQEVMGVKLPFSDREVAQEVLS